jgi:hypothetical protein
LWGAQQEGYEMKKPSVPKCFGGSQKIFLGCSTSSLAVFYVEQVALKSPRAPPLPATLFMRHTGRDVKAEKFWQSNRQELTDRKTVKAVNATL